MARLRLGQILLQAGVCTQDDLISAWEQKVLFGDRLGTNLLAGAWIEEKDWKDNRDPIIRFRSWLVEEGIAGEDEIEAMNEEIKADATAAVEYALAARYPDVSEVDMHVYTDVTHALARSPA